MTKRCFALLAVLWIALAMIACGGDDDGANEDPADGDDDAAADDDDDDDGGEEPIPPVDGDPPSLDENRYHWDGVENPFFEGWYYKLNDPASGLAFFFIYSVIFPGDPANGIGVMQFGGGPDHAVHFVEFPVSDFHASRDHCEVYLGSTRNAATQTTIKGDIDTGEGPASWELAITPQVSWADTMGWLTNFEDVDVNWHVAHLLASASGFVEMGGARYEFDDAVLYSDHNWGPVFPEYWMWMQGAHFENGADAVALSGGIVNSPWGTFDAYMIGYLRDGVLHTFRTQDQAQIAGFYGDLVWTVDAIQDNERLNIWAAADAASVLDLYIPTPAGMVPGADETLTGAIGVTLFEKRQDDWVRIDSRVTDHAGVEAGGGMRDAR